MIPLPLLDGDTLLIDSSSTSDVMTCKRLAQYSYCRHLRSTDEKAALRAGGIAHKVLETRYRAASAMYAQSPEVESVMIATAEREYNGYTLHPGTAMETVVPGWSPPEDDFRTFSTMVSMIREYGLKYPFESFDILSLSDGKPFIEVPFIRPFCELHVNARFLVQPLKITPLGIERAGPAFEAHIDFLKVAWIGRIDLVYETSSGVYVMDHKTSTIATNTGEFTISHQLYGYVDAVEYLLGGRQVSGFVVNRIVWRKPTRTGVPFTFERALTTASRTLLAEWKQDVIHIIADLVEAVRRGYMQRETVWCYGKFGQCPFHKVCTLDTPEQREVLLGSGEFSENTWSPLT